MPEERFLTIQLHELLMYLGQQGVATILIGAHQGLIGTQMNTPVDASYLADAVILLRYFEARGEVRQAISVMKKRGSKHERTIREFRLDRGASASATRCAISAASSPACPSTKAPTDVRGDDEPRHERERRARLGPPRARPRADQQGRRHHGRRCCRPPAFALEICRDLRRARPRAAMRAPPPILLPEEAVSRPAHRRSASVLAEQPPGPICRCSS